VDSEDFQGMKFIARGRCNSRPKKGFASFVKKGSLTEKQIAVYITKIHFLNFSKKYSP
jgi:hypothetical protein